MIATAEGRPKEKRATNVASLLSITKMCAHLREQIGENKGFKAGGHGLPFAAFAECNQLHKPDCFLMIVRLAEAQTSAKQASETFWTNGISYECKTDTNVPPIRKRKMSSSMRLCSQDFLW